MSLIAAVVIDEFNNRKSNNGDFYIPFLTGIKNVKLNNTWEFRLNKKRGKKYGNVR